MIEATASPADFGFLLLVWCALSLAAAGVVKGLIGIGIPMVSIALLSLAISIPQAVVLLPVPILVTNAWQSINSGYFLKTLSRFWPLLLALVAGTAVGGYLLATVELHKLQMAIGAALVVFAALNLASPRLFLPAKAEAGAGALAGGLGGVLGGMSALFAPPILMFLVAIRLHKDEFVGTINTIYLIGGLVLTAALAGFRVMGAAEFGWSALATLPLFAGMLLGQKLRHRISQEAFRKGLLVAVMLIGMNLFVRAVV